MEPSQQLSYKIVLAGASGVGKTCFLRRHRGAFVKEHIPTMGVEVHPIVFHTTRGPITFKVWDLAGRPEFAGLGGGYYLGAHGLLVFYDLTAPATLVAASDLLDAHLGEGEARLAAVLCGTKLDLCEKCGSGRPGKPYPKVPYYELSARNCYNLEEPFLSLARQLTGDAELALADAPALVPPEVPVDLVLLAAWRAVAPPAFDPQEREFTYRMGARIAYDGFGEALRNDLEELLEEADADGYDTSICVLLTFEKRA